jgi:hypothetical protein
LEVVSPESQKGSYDSREILRAVLLGSKWGEQSEHQLQSQQEGWRTTKCYWKRC